MRRSIKASVILILILSISLFIPFRSRAERTLSTIGSSSSNSTNVSISSRSSRTTGSSSTPATNPSSAPGDKITTKIDTYIDQKNPNTSYGTSSTLQINSTINQIKQGLIKFDVSAIPTGDTVTSAKLWVYVYQKGSSNNSVSIYESLGSWSQSTTWNSKPARDSVRSGSVTITKSGDYVVLDITGLVQDWVSGHTPNNGMYLVAGSGSIILNSAENRSNKPVLTVAHKRSGTGTPSATAAPTPVPTNTPSPTPTSTPAPNPTTNMPMTYGCTMYGASQPYPGSSSDVIMMNKYKSYCTVVMQKWYPLPSHSYCNALRTSPTTVKVCGSYNNFGFTFTDDPGWSAVSQYHLGNAYNLYGATPTSEAVMDYTAPGFISWFSNILTNGWSPNHMKKAGSGMNSLFFDNGVFDPTWLWNTYPISASQRKVDALNFLSDIRNVWNTNGDYIVMNGYSDISESTTSDPNYYYAVLDMVDYIVFERTTTDIKSGKAGAASQVLNFIKKAYDYNTNTSTVVLWNTEYGDFWYNFSTGLLACTAKKCGFWQQPPMTSNQIVAVGALVIGIPVNPYSVVNGCYVRPFTNGYVVVNLSDSGSACTVPLNGCYQNLATGTNECNSTTVNAKSGKVFIH